MNHDRVNAAVGRMERRTATQQAEAKRLASVRSLGHVPKDCGPEIPDAPARGPVVQFMPRAAYPDGKDGYTIKDAGHQGRKALRAADAFDVMAVKAAGNGKPVPFTPAQVAMARDYATLFEKHECAGVRCSSVEAMPQGGGGSGGEYIDAVLADGERLALLQRRIGGGMAMVIRRQRPSDERINITDRRLVDDVCIAGLTISAVLKKYHWPKYGKSVAMLAEVLRDALDRMAGPVRAPRTCSVKYGQQVSSPFS